MIRLIFLLLSVILLGCQDVKMPEKPENLIPKPKMVDVLTEAYLMNAARSYDLRLIRDKGIQLDSLIYKSFDIDSLQFAKSNAYYTSDLNGYNELLEEVESRLLVMQAKADSIDEVIKEKRREARRQDSIAGRKYDTISDDAAALERQKLVDSMRRASLSIDPLISQ